MADDTPIYDLEKRTFQFALRVRHCIGKHKWPVQCWEDTPQLLRSSGSVGANYIEANDSVSDPDFIYRIKIYKKESKESRYWSRLLRACGPEQSKQELGEIQQEADELMRIFAKILINRGTTDKRTS